MKKTFRIKIEEAVFNGKFWGSIVVAVFGFVW